ncbi:HAD family hydrolase [Enterococcus sp. DIV0187]|uniref:HAD family hydrolase n=1 Tax=Enterococcus sp. DIV0187 TaxID=2774644 RepID=UPI003F20499A
MKLIGIDLDGTLLNSQQKISKKNVEVLGEISEKCFPFICSGREVEDIKNILKENKLSIPAIGLNGAVGYDYEKKLFEFYFNHSSVKKISSLTSKFPTKIYTNNGSYESNEYKARLKEIFSEIGNEFSIDELNYELEYEKSIQSTSYNNINDIFDIDGVKVYKFFVFIPNRKMKSKIKKELESIHGITVTESSEVNLEIVPYNVSKGLVYSHLEKIYGLKNVTKFAIGDSLNDLSLFEMSDFSFAMGNGHQTIKNMATYVISSNDEDGVAEALKAISAM